MQKETAVVLVVVVAVVVALVLLTMQVARLRERVRRLERKPTPAELMSRLAAAELGQTRLTFELQTQARLAAAAQAQSVTELRALRDELTSARVEQSNTAIGAPRADEHAEADAADEQRNTVAMPAPTSPASTPVRPLAFLAPLTDPDLIGSEDIADEAARSRLGPEELTPPRRGRATMLVHVFQAARERGV